MSAARFALQLPWPAWLLKAWRGWLLKQGPRIDPQKMQALGQRAAWAVAREAARRSPAYRQLMSESGLHHSSWPAAMPWQALPLLHKENTFGRFALAELSGSLKPGDIADLLTSSGRGGQTFGMRLSNRRTHATAWYDMDLGLQDAFDVDRLPTLVVNCLPMGVVFSSRAAAVANVSVREDMACAVLQQAGPAFAQTLVCTDPLFVNRLLDHAQQLGIDWQALNTSFVLGEEMLVENQRAHIARRIGISPEAPGRRMVGSSFGVAELGLNLLFETRETIALRRALQQQPGLARELCAGGAMGAEAGLQAEAGRGKAARMDASGPTLPSLFCFNPLRCHVEVVATNAAGHGWGALCLTLLDQQAVLPLPRYATGDQACLISPALAQFWATSTGLPLPWLPMVAVLGRSSDRRPGQPSVEDIKQALYADEALAACLTGAFRLQRGQDDELLLLLQLKSAALQSAAHQRLPLLLPRLQGVQGPPWNLRALTVEGFDDRPLVDYERKFRYLVV